MTTPEEQAAIKRAKSRMADGNENCDCRECRNARVLLSLNEKLEAAREAIQQISKLADDDLIYDGGYVVNVLCKKALAQISEPQQEGKKL